MRVRKKCVKCGITHTAQKKDICGDCVRANLLYKVPREKLMERYRRSQLDGFHRHYSDIKRLIVKWRNGYINQFDIWKIIDIYISIINLHEPYEQRPPLEQAGFMLLELKNLMNFEELWNDKIPQERRKKIVYKEYTLPNKTCRTCQIEKPAEDFYKCKDGDGLRPDCKTCHKKNVYATYKARMEQWK